MEAFAENLGYDITSWDLNLDGNSVVIVAVGTPCATGDTFKHKHIGDDLMEYLGVRLTSFFKELDLSGFNLARFRIQPKNEVEFEITVTGVRRQQ